MEDSDVIRETASQYTPDDLCLTYEDYYRIPAGERFELVGGDLRKMTPAPSVKHQEISGRIEKALWQWVDERAMGKVYHSPIDVVLNEHHVVQPDIIYITRERLGIVREANIWGAPDLVVEITSPSTAEWDRVTKRRIYGHYGIREYWLVEPEGRSIEVAVQNGRELATVHVFTVGTTMASPLLPGLAVEIDEVMAT